MEFELSPSPVRTVVCNGKVKQACQACTKMMATRSAGKVEQVRACTQKWAPSGHVNMERGLQPNKLISSPSSRLDSLTW